MKWLIDGWTHQSSFNRKAITYWCAVKFSLVLVAEFNDCNKTLTFLIIKSNKYMILLISRNNIEKKREKLLIFGKMDIFICFIFLSYAMW